MAERRSTSVGAWLSGARAAGADLGVPGERLGLPEHGRGAVAPYGRRLAALMIDWIVAMFAAAFLAGQFGWSPQTRSWAVLAVFGVEVYLLTALLGTTIGKRLCGLRVIRSSGAPPGPVWSLVRTVLLLAVIPAVVLDRDRRGLHDRAAETVVVRG